MTDAAEAYDRGADGPACVSRPYVMQDVEGRSRGSAQPGELVQAKRYLDGTRYDKMHHAGQLSDREYAAARRIGALRWGARLGARVTPRYGVTGRALTSDAWGAEDEYHAAMRTLTQEQDRLVLRLLEGEGPGFRNLPTLQDALRRLAEYFGISHDVDPYETLDIDCESD